MTPSEARTILGVEVDATADQIKSAFRAKAKVAHPDQGGSTEEFQKLSEAQDVLTKPQPQQNSYRTGDTTFDENGNYYHYEFSHEDISERLREHFMNMNRAPRVQQIAVSVDLETAFEGGVTSIQLRSAEGIIKKDIPIPKGIGHGDVLLEFEESSVHVSILANIVSEDYNIAWHPFQRGNMAGEAHISALKMITGGWEEIPTLGGKKVRAFITPGFKTGNVLKVKGKGYWGDKQCSRRGDLMLRVFPLISKFDDLPKADIEAFLKLVKEKEQKTKVETIDIKV